MRRCRLALYLSASSYKSITQWCWSASSKPCRHRWRSHAIRRVVRLLTPNQICYTHGIGATAEKDRQVNSGRHYRVHADQGRLEQCAEFGATLWGAAQALEWLTPKKYKATKSANPSNHKVAYFISVSVRVLCSYMCNKCLILISSTKSEDSWSSWRLPRRGSLWSRSKWLAEPVHSYHVIIIQ